MPFSDNRPIRAPLAGACLQPLLVALLLVLPGRPPPALAAAEAEPILQTWLTAQEQIRTWSAEFVQTRTLKTLVEPLKTKGKVWFAAPNQFRWELGDPVQTIAVRTSSELLIIYPRLRRVERFSMNRGQSGPWRDALALLEAGFPRSQSELEAQYKVLSQRLSGTTAEILLEPKSTGARRMIPRIQIEFDAAALTLLSTQLQFADGSTMRNDFTSAVLNPDIDPALFRADIPNGYKIVEPLSKP